MCVSHTKKSITRAGLRLAACMPACPDAYVSSCLSVYLPACLPACVLVLLPFLCVSFLFPDRPLTSFHPCVYLHLCLSVLLSPIFSSTGIIHASTACPSLSLSFSLFGSLYLSVPALSAAPPPVPLRSSGNYVRRRKSLSGFHFVADFPPSFQKSKSLSY